MSLISSNLIFPAAQSAGAADYTDCISAVSPNECPGMTLNNLMVNLH